MKIKYDIETDTLRILLRDVPIEESEEETPGVIVDYDEAGDVVGFEVLDASRRVENPKAIEYAIA